MKMKYRLLKKTLLETLPRFLHTFVTRDPSFAVQPSLQGFTVHSKRIPTGLIKAPVLKIELGISHPKPIISPSGGVKYVRFQSREVISRMH